MSTNRPFRLAIALLANLAGVTSLAAQTCTTSVTGTPVPALASLDQQVLAAMQQNSIKGGSLAIAFNGRLIFAHGYGCADTDANLPVQPDSLMRVASISKGFTAVGILQLVQQGKLSLDAKVFGPSGILSKFQPVPGKTINPEVLNITVRHLLEHAGGWDRSTTQFYNGVPYNEPIDGLLYAAPAALGNPQPGITADVIRVMLSQPLQHAPGTYFAYSNFGYAVLGRVIEAVSGLGYEQYVQQNILKPLGIGRQKQADSLLSDQVNGEVKYYDVPNAPLVKSVFDRTTLVPRPYGGKLLETLDSAGAWVTDAVDLTRFIDGIDGRRPGSQALLTAATIQQMLADPKLQGQGNSYYGLGFLVTPVTVNGVAQFRWAKGGDLTGTATNAVHAATGYTFAVLFNGNPSFDPNNDDGSSKIQSDVSGAVLTAVNQLGNGAPAGDLYANFKSTLLTPTISSVVQGATLQPAIVSGSWVTIFGQNLGTATRTWMAREFDGANLPTEIDHVLATINGKPAAVYYVSPTQLNVQAPTDTATGPVTVQVIRDGTASAPFQATLTSAEPGFFTYAADGKQHLAALHVDGSVIGDVAGTRPAKAGEVVELYATALTASTGGVIPSAPIALSTLPTVTIGGVNAPVSFAGIVSPGLFQINVTIPNVSAGMQPAAVSYGGQISPAGPVIAVGSN